MPTATVTTPTKTLQQKLAERQKEIQAKMESSSNTNAKKKSQQANKIPIIDNDVIVLDE